MIIAGHNNVNWRLKGFYGFPEHSKRQDSWNLLTNLVRASSISWACIEDFNDLLSMEDKIGGNPHPESLFCGFHDTLPFYVEWGRGLANWIRERLDRALVSQSWMDLFLNCKLSNLHSSILDHSPILLETDCNWGKSLRGNFRKEAARIHRELDAIRGSDDETSVVLKDSLKEDLNRILVDEEIFWKQRTKNFWLKEGDSNTHFFHAHAL
ncbi:hypothetical protein P3X46_033987 [Hevea brasiliensis]|uniref:Endonuclease/exonuclease/phosphatase domain-containing protein n=1 Tax=Hevea brasiliensis TaxID=3981 RepID=A0ABQ9KBV8_HEVBR|nr:hypothetical protein P3X46_033987 [Hevea brasiliensis]